MCIDSKYRKALSMASSKPTWIAQRRYEGQVEYFSIVDLIETQHLLHDVIKIFLYGYVTDVGQGLNAEAELWFSGHATQTTTTNATQEFTHRRIELEPIIPSENQEPFKTTDITPEYSCQTTDTNHNKNITLKNHTKIEKTSIASTCISKRVQGMFATKWIKEGRVFQKRK